MPRVVLDPNVLVSALITPRGASAQLLVELRGGAFELVTSPLLLDELADVLGRPKLRRYVTEEEGAEFVELIRGASVVIDDPPAPAVAIGDDPGDEYLVTLARAARVDALVSGDPRLLGLRGRIPVQPPREFLEALAR